MARSAVWILGAACLFSHTQGVLGRDGDGEEYFPLSGGAKPGFKVTVKAASVSGNNSMIDFLTAARQVAFRFHVDVANQKVVRSSMLGANDVEHSYGGWLGLTDAAHFEFYHTEHSWRVSSVADGVATRFPWFDFPHATSDLMTHVSVHDGLQDVEVLVSRPTCTTPCLASECLDGSGGDVCGAGENSSCYTRSVADTNQPWQAASCSAGQETGPSAPGLVCCDGVAPAFPVSELSVDSWVKVHDDAAYVDRACAAFANEDKTCGTWAGKTAQILSANPADGTYSVWMPSAATENLAPPNYTFPETSVYNYPGAALTVSYLTRKAVTLTDGRAVWTDDFEADGHNGLVWKAGATANANGIEAGMFINELGFFPYKNGEERWSAFSYYSDSIIPIQQSSDIRTVRLILTNWENRITPECVGDLDYADANDNTCANFTANEWCNRHGEATQDWCDNVGVGVPSDGCNGNAFYYGGGDPVRGTYPMTECCQCGGGNRTVPVEFASADIAQVFQ